MSLENFLVRPKRRFVEKYAAAAAWRRIDADAHHEVSEHLSGLPSAATDDDVAAKQFDLLVFRTELAVLRVDPHFRALKGRIIETASLLEELSNVPMVRAELALIQEVQTDGFWQDVTLPMLDTVRRRLRALVKLIEFKKRPLVYSDFEDRAGLSSDVAVTGLTAGTDIDSFRRMARHFLKAHENHIAILKLRRNEPLTPVDLAELERIFLEAGVDERFVEILRAEGGLGRFVRSLVGLDRQAAKQAFAEFLNGRALSSDQIEFLDLVVDHLTARGLMDPKLLYESPFTDFHSNGVEGVFAPADVVHMVHVLRDIETRSAA